LKAIKKGAFFSVEDEIKYYIRHPKLYRISHSKFNLSKQITKELLVKKNSQNSIKKTKAILYKEREQPKIFYGKPLKITTLDFTISQLYLKNRQAFRI
jgi:hypothetical protein